MNRENILFTAVGLLLGYVIAFHLVVYVNQSETAATAPGAAGASGSAEGLPADHPAVAGANAQEQQRLRAAADEAARAARANPDDFDAQMRAAEDYLTAGDFEDALDFMSRANKLRPDHYDTVVKLGSVYSAAGRFEDAERWYAAALAKRPDDSDARSELAVTYYLREPSQPEKAISELRRALESDPDHIPSLHNLALVLFKTKKYEESEKVLARLEKADPTYEELPRLRQELEKARAGASAPPSGAQKKTSTD